MAGGSTCHAHDQADNGHQPVIHAKYRCPQSAAVPHALMPGADFLD